MEFDQTVATNGLWGKDECVKFWGQKVKGQGRALQMHFLVLLARYFKC